MSMGEGERSLTTKKMPSIKYLIWDRPCNKLFTYTFSSSHPPNTSVRYITSSYSHFVNENTEATKRLRYFPRTFRNYVMKLGLELWTTKSKFSIIPKAEI